MVILCDRYGNEKTSCFSAADSAASSSAIKEACNVGGRKK